MAINKPPASCPEYSLLSGGGDRFGISHFRSNQTSSSFDCDVAHSACRPCLPVVSLARPTLKAAMLPGDEILIQELELLGSVGVTEEERRQPQRLVVSLALRPPNHFGEVGEDLSRTIDYAAVCAELRRFVTGRRDSLIETLAHRMAEHILRSFDVCRVELELRKFILPETRYVAVRVLRKRGASR